MRDKIVAFVRALRSLFAGGSIVFLFGCLIVLLILFVVKPGLRDSTEKAMAFYASLVPSAIGAIIGAYLLRSFKRTLDSAGSLSGAVSSWLAREPLLLAFLWVVAIIELTALSYVVPVYALRLELRVDDSGSVAARVASVAEYVSGL